MRRTARSTTWQRRLSFGGRIPWAVGLLLSLTVVLSLTAALGNRHVGELFAALALRPADVWRGQVWRLVTWPFVEASPIGLLFACLSLYWFAPSLAQQSGSWRFLRLVAGIVMAAGAGTCLIALIDPAVFAASYLGTWTLMTALVVLWGLTFPNQVIRVYFVLPIRGLWVAWGTVALTVVYAIYNGWAGLLPVALGEGAALLWFFRVPVLAQWSSARRSMGARPVRRTRERGAVVDFRTGDRVRSDDRDPPN